MMRQFLRWQLHLRLLLGLLCCLLLSHLLAILTPPGASSSSAVSPHERRPRSVESPPAAAAAAAASPSRPLYVVTATYPRPEQEAELVRLAQTLMHAPFVHWVVVEDARRRTPAVRHLLRRSGVRHVHLLGEIGTSEMRSKVPWGRVPRGVSNRNTGLRWVRENAGDGVVYFADDDNSYDIRLFTELRKTRAVGVVPVGLVSRQGVSSPVVRGGRVVAFFDGWIGGREFPMDMAGFAVSTDWLRQNPEAEMPYKAGYEEDGFLKALRVTRDDLEPLADNCTQILVWHTQTQKVEPFDHTDLGDLSDTNIARLTEHIIPKST